MTCDVCKTDTGHTHTIVFRGDKRIAGHARCLDLVPRFGNLKHGWNDGSKGSYSPAWLDDVKHRKVVKGGEVIRDYGRRYFS